MLGVFIILQMTISKLITAAPNIDWKTFFDICGVDVGPVAEDAGHVLNVTHPKVIPILNSSGRWTSFLK